MICGHTIDHRGTFAWPELVTTFSIRRPLPSYSGGLLKKRLLARSWPLILRKCTPRMKNGVGGEVRPDSQGYP